MQRIIEQISDIIEFNGCTFDEINQERDTFAMRIEEGLKKMNEYGAFTIYDINEVKAEAYKMLSMRYCASYQRIKYSLIEKFEF